MEMFYPLKQSQNSSGWFESFTNNMWSAMRVSDRPTLSVDPSLPMCMCACVRACARARASIMCGVRKEVRK